MRKTLPLITALLLASTLTACAESAKFAPDLADQSPNVNAITVTNSPDSLLAASRGGGAGGRPSEKPATFTPTALPAPTDPSPQSTPIPRQMIYSASLNITVPDIAAAESSARATALSLHGYLDSLDGNAITIRVPAPAFDDARAALERLGEVTSRQLKADDVTEQMRDLHIRLDNAEAMRKQLQSLLDKAAKMEDALKIEQELARVTESIELLKGKLQFMDAQVAFSTLRATFNSVHPQTPAADAVPFAWVRDLASGPIAGISESSPDTSRLFHRNDRFQLPAGFVRYYEREHLTELLSADGCTIKMRRVDNYDGGTIDFWATLAHSTLSDARAISISSDTPTTLSDKTPAHILTGTRDTGGGGPHQTYMLCLAATDRYVYAFEAWGPSDKLTPRLPDIQKSFTTLDAKHW